MLAKRKVFEELILHILKGMDDCRFGKAGSLFRTRAAELGQFDTEVKLKNRTVKLIKMLSMNNSTQIYCLNVVKEICLMKTS